MPSLTEGTLWPPRFSQRKGIYGKRATLLDVATYSSALTMCFFFSWSFISGLLLIFILTTFDLTFLPEFSLVARVYCSPPLAAAELFFCTTFDVVVHSLISFLAGYCRIGLWVSLQMFSQQFLSKFYVQIENRLSVYCQGCKNVKYAMLPWYQHSVTTSAVYTLRKEHCLKAPFLCPPGDPLATT